jgi:hypothetical protein
MHTFRGFLEEGAADLNLPKMYSTFNKLYFDNELPTNLKVTWFKSKSVGGVASATYDKRTKSFISINGIKLSSVLKRSKKHVVALLLHEMIHIWVYVQGIPYTGGRDKSHGWEFQDKKKEIERKSGIQIPDTEDIQDAELGDHLKGKTKRLGIIAYVKKDMGVSINFFTEKMMKEKSAEIVAYHEKYESHVTGNYRLVLIGFASTDLHAKFPVKRSWKKGIGGGIHVSQDEFKAVTGAMASEKGVLRMFKS